MTYTIRVYENGRVIQKLVYENLDDYIRECMKRGFMLTTDAEQDKKMKEELSLTYGLVLDDSGNYVEKRAL